MEKQKVYKGLYIEQLRKDLLNETKAVAFNGCDVAFLEVDRIQKMEDEELMQYAQSRNYDLATYILKIT